MDSPTPQQIREWKDAYGPIYQVEEFIFRGVTISEATSIFLSKTSSVDKEEELFHTAVLWPTDITIDDTPAGIVSAVADEIQNASGYGDPKFARELLEQYRNARTGRIFNLMKAMIIAAIPAYTDEDLDRFTFPKLLEKVVLAEQVMGIKQNILSGDTISLDLLDPEEEADKAQRMATVKNASRKPGQAISGDPIAEKLKNALR